MKKRILSILITVVMLIGMLPTAVFAEDTTPDDLSIGGVEVTDANKDDLVTAINQAANGSVAAGSATYDPATSTLTLNNFSCSSNAFAGVIHIQSGNITIKLKGNNTLTATGTNTAGISSNRDLVICNGEAGAAQGQLTINTGATACISAYSRTLEITNVKVTAESTENYVLSAGSISLSGVTLSATGGWEPIYTNSVTLVDPDTYEPVYDPDTGRPVKVPGPINIENSTVVAYCTGGYYAFESAPTITSNLTVYAGNDEASALKVGSPTDETYTTSKYVRIEPLKSYTVTTFDINGVTRGGSYSIDKTTAIAGETVTITVVPNLGYLIESVTFNCFATTNNGGGTYSFTMPAQNVSVSVTFDVDLPAITKELKELNDADAALQTAISNGDKDLTNEIIALQAAIAQVQNAVDDLDNGYATDSQLNALKSELEGKITSAQTSLQTAIDQVQTNLDTAIADLNSAIATGDAALDGKITALTNALNAAKAALEATDTANKSELEGKITSAQTSLQTAINTVQTNLDTAIADLNSAITTGDAALDSKITALTNALNAAKAALEATDTANKSELEGKITSAQTTLEAAIDNVQTNLDNAKAELDQAIADLDAAMEQGDADLSAEIAAVNTALANAQAALEKADEDNKAELVKKIEDADKILDDAVKTVQKNLDDAKAELDKAIADGDTALDGKITNLNTALNNAVAALEKADSDNKAALEAKIEATEATLDAAIKAVQKNLDDAKEELNKAIADGNTELDGKITALGEALAIAKATLEATDSANKSELTTKIDEADAALQTAINALSNELNATNEKVAELETFIIIVCVIAGVAFCGCGTLTVFYIIDKKKNI